eukprot:TRINITY_DN7934_c0_g1_i2.p1 TRINITY_DN7934_c0_g1~~TRINITY_DN7934_c0_g1_i2.p1  ORF type:complete len:270 (+),score=61.86 TRINITY_DN7934_c0_g1_i2:254-1063(+)
MWRACLSEMLHGYFKETNKTKSFKRLEFINVQCHFQRRRCFQGDGSLRECPKPVRPDPVFDWSNPHFSWQMCLWNREWQLLGLRRFDCLWAQRLLAATALGALIGIERSSAHQSAGFHLTTLVSMSTCVFTIGSQFAFLDSPMDWDGARVAAALPSGCGFLAGAVIWKTSEKEGGLEVTKVHGLPTAAAVWFAAAAGTACGGKLYPIAVYGTAGLIFTLRGSVLLLKYHEKKAELLSIAAGEMPASTTVPLTPLMVRPRHVTFYYAAQD